MPELKLLWSDNSFIWSYNEQHLFLVYADFSLNLEFNFSTPAKTILFITARFSNSPWHKVRYFRMLIKTTLKGIVERSDLNTCFSELVVSLSMWNSVGSSLNKTLLYFVWLNLLIREANLSCPTAARSKYEFINLCRIIVWCKILL